MKRVEYLNHSGTFLHSRRPGDMLSWEHMLVFGWALLNMVHLHTGRTPAQDGSVPGNATLRMSVCVSVCGCEAERERERKRARERG